MQQAPSLRGTSFRRPTPRPAGAVHRRGDGFGDAGTLPLQVAGRRFGSGRPDTRQGRRGGGGEPARVASGGLEPGRDARHEVQSADPMLDDPDLLGRRLGGAAGEVRRLRLELLARSGPSPCRARGGSRCTSRRSGRPTLRPRRYCLRTSVTSLPALASETSNETRSPAFAVASTAGAALNAIVIAGQPASGMAP